MITVGVFGATGYTGFETIKLIRNHPDVTLKFATSESFTGQSLSQVYPVSWDVPLIPSDEAPLDVVDAVFCCLPHAASMPTVLRARSAGVKVIDLSADFRLNDADIYRQWYGVEHTAPAMLDEAVYGLCEVFRDDIRQTSLLANPGCYPTSLLLALYPLLTRNLLDPHAPVISDSKSGVSGAGRKPGDKTHFVAVNENLSPYNIGQTHRHISEMAQTVKAIGRIEPPIIFSPHLVPITRGMLSTIYVSLSESVSAPKIQSIFEETYHAEPLVRVLPPGELATFAHTQNANNCAISITPVNERQLILCSSIDNLGKGAAGQAVQNLNIMFGFNETAGLQ